MTEGSTVPFRQATAHALLLRPAPSRRRVLPESGAHETLGGMKRAGTLALGLWVQGCVILAPVDEVVEDGPEKSSVGGSKPSPARPITAPSDGQDSGPAAPSDDDTPDPRPVTPDPTDTPTQPSEPAQQADAGDPGPPTIPPTPTGPVDPVEEPPVPSCSDVHEACSDDVQCCGPSTLCLSLPSSGSVCTKYGCFGDESCEVDEVCHFDVVGDAEGNVAGARLCVSPDDLSGPIPGSNPCGGNSDCDSGFCTPLGYCYDECSNSLDCGFNYWSEANDSCIVFDGYAACVPTCYGDIDCAPYGGTSCILAYTAEGATVQVCG